MEVPKTVFTPAPKVTSAVLHLVKRKEPLVQVEDDKYFFSIVKASFAHRRKTLRNNMISFLKNRWIFNSSYSEFCHFHFKYLCSANFSFVNIAYYLCYFWFFLTRYQCGNINACSVGDGGCFCH